jgi:hypothetical protein
MNEAHTVTQPLSAIAAARSIASPQSAPLAMANVENAV